MLPFALLGMSVWRTQLSSFQRNVWGSPKSWALGEHQAPFLGIWSARQGHSSLCDQGDNFSTQGNNQREHTDNLAQQLKLTLTIYS